MKTLSWCALLGACCAAAAGGGTFGRVAPIGGHASDLALDEAGGVLYVANFTANRIELMSPADGAIRGSINVAPQPSALALTADGRYLVVAHFGNFQPPNSPQNALTVIDRSTGARQVFALAEPPLGVAFGRRARGLVVTPKEFLAFDAVTGALEHLALVADVTAKTLPAPPANFPPQIVAASLGVSGDGWTIYGLTDTIRFVYNLAAGTIRSLGYTATPPLGPRVVSVSENGSYYTAGWGLFEASGTLLAQFPNAAGLLNVGSHAIDSARGMIYAQIPEAGGAPQSPQNPASPATAPRLMVVDADNLTVRERLRIPENLAGRSVLTRDGSMLYSISDSGVMLLPVGALGEQRRIEASHEDLVFRGSFCNRREMTQEFWITDASGASTDFTISASQPGIRLEPSWGTTPVRVRVSVDPAQFQNVKGTVATTLQIASEQAVNVPPAVRVLVNLRGPEQQGRFVNVPGKLADVLADAWRDRFYVLRQDKNQLMVFDGATQELVKTLRTGNTPTQMALVFGGRYLMVGNDNSQIANVYDLDTLEPLAPIRFPPGHYPRSVAASARAILAACRVAGPKHTIDKVNWETALAWELPTLGAYENRVHLNTALAASPGGGWILAAQGDGSVLLYSAAADTFTAWRKDFLALAGACGASDYDQFYVGGALLNSSLVPVHRFDEGGGTSSGLVFLDPLAVRTVVGAKAPPGVIERLDLGRGERLRPTRMAEAPLVGDSGAPFTRTLAALASGRTLISLTTSGFTVLPWSYDAGAVPPQIERVVSAADSSTALASGGLIAVEGRELAGPGGAAEACVTVNGQGIPVLAVSPGRVTAQLPFSSGGSALVAAQTAGGVSDNIPVTILPVAPRVFHNGTAGPNSNLAAIVHGASGELVTLSSPVHRGEALVIFATGLGRTVPAVETGAPAPSDPPAEVMTAPEVELGAVNLPVLFAGLTPGQIGVYQINVQVPGWAPLGMEVPLTIRQGTSETAVAVRVVD